MLSGVMANVFDPNTQEAEAVRFPNSRLAWSTGFQDSQCSREKLCLKKNGIKKQKE